MTVVLLGGLASVGTFALTLAVLAAVFRLQVRQYNSTIAAERLEEWDRELGLLSPEEREHRRAMPPADVLAAMASLPATGRRSIAEGWGERPTRLR